LADLNGIEKEAAMAPEQALREKLIDLWKLQVLDNEIIDFEEERDKIPNQTGNLDEKLLAKQSVLETKQKLLATAQNDVREKQRLLDLERLKLKNTRNKEAAIQNIQQYEAYVKEVEMQSGSSELYEKQIKDLNARIGTLTTEIEDLKTQIVAIEESVASQRDELEQRILDLDSALDELFNRRDAFVKNLDARLYRQYEFIAERVGDGVAIARVVEGHCEACNMQLMPQMANEIMAGRQIHACNSCSRLLVYIDEAEAE
jgi:predicted  nucleic acid-binding Zn-ribbon protein